MEEWKAEALPARIAGMKKYPAKRAVGIMFYRPCLLCGMETCGIGFWKIGQFKNLRKVRRN